jgi:hypothetical protein
MRNASRELFAGSHRCTNNEICFTLAELVWPLRNPAPRQADSAPKRGAAAE